MSCSETLRTQAFIDGELDEAAAVEAERHIATCPECRAFSEHAADLSDAVARTATRHAVPAPLRARIMAALERERRGPRFDRFWAGILSGVAASALAAGLAALLWLPPSANSLLEEVGQAHVDAMSEGTQIAVLSSNHHTVKPWFAGRADVSPPVADFASAGFPLAGGRAAEIAGSRAAVVVYRHGLHEIDLFVWAGRGAAAQGVYRGYHIIFWQKGDLNFAAVSDTEWSELKNFERLVQAEPE